MIVFVKLGRRRSLQRAESEADFVSFAGEKMYRESFLGLSLHIRIPGLRACISESFDQSP